MPPKRSLSLNSIEASVTSSRVRQNQASDLVTRSEAALSSQASIYTQHTQRTQASQQSNLNYGMMNEEEMQFNREDMSEVFINKEQEQQIHKILQFARKGKINAKNAFDLPFKVVNAESSFRVNNKFWKFASQLLSATMNIYDKRVQWIYTTVGAFENKLSRVGFEIIGKKGQEENEERFDDINADEEEKGKRNRKERQAILNISIDDFSGAMNLDDENIIGFQTLDKKEKLDIKNVEHKFIADPTFQRTQKMFDSFSLKSLMLNIFEISNDLSVRIFHKSDLQWEKMKGKTPEQQIRMEKIYIPSKDKQNCQQDIQIDENNEQENQQNNQKEQAKSQETVSCNFKNLMSTTDFSFDFDKHISKAKSILDSREILPQINDFLASQPELMQDYDSRNQKVLSLQENTKLQVQDDNKPKPKQKFFGDIIQNQRLEFIQIFREFHQSFDQDTGVYHFDQIQDCQGLYETHATQSQTFDHQNDGLDSFFSMHNHSQSENIQTNSMHSAPICFKDSFFGWGQQSNIIEPIMPWEIEFKNLKLIKKKKPSNSTMTTNKSKRSKKQSHGTIVNFQLDILDRKQSLRTGDTKKKFLNQRFKTKYQEKNLISKDFQPVHAQYHTKFNPRKKYSQQMVSSSGSQQLSYPKNQSQQINHENGHTFPLDFQTERKFDNKNIFSNLDEETRQQQPFDQQAYSGQVDFSASALRTQMVSKNTSFYGNQMGVNNIREIKKIIVEEINEKGTASLVRMNQILVNLSPQQMFTIFLHLTNEHQYLIFNNEPDETDVTLKISENQQHNRRMQTQHEDEEKVYEI